MICAIAMGKIAADSSIIEATPGISVSTVIDDTNLFGSGHAGGYTVTLPARLVKNKPYVLMLTAENYGEDGPDYVITSICSRNETNDSFEVLIWADRVQTLSGYTFTTVRTDWQFVIFRNIRFWRFWS